MYYHLNLRSVFKNAIIPNYINITDHVQFQEFHTIYQQFFPNGDPTKFASFVFNVFDANKVQNTILH